MSASMWEEERESVCGHSVRRSPAGRCSALLSLAVWWCGCQQVCGRKRERERVSVCGHSIRRCPAGRSALSSSAVWWCVDGSKYE